MSCCLGFLVRVPVGPTIEATPSLFLADRGRNMSKVQSSLRETIARNIRECRLERFPGRGGSKKCAAEFSRYIGQNISPQQWSPWERGMRMPKERHLQQIAAFFGKTIEYMCGDNRQPIPAAPVVPHYDESAVSSYAGMSAPELVMAMGRRRMKAVYQVEISVASVKFVPCDELRRE